MPRFRRWAGPLPLATAVVGLALVPLSTSTGETLERHVPHSALVAEHAHLADGLLPWMAGLTVVSVALYAWRWRLERGRLVSRAVSASVIVLAVAASLGTTVQVVRIGHSGARAAWSQTHMATPTR